MPKPSTPLVYKPGKVAELLGISKPVVYALIHSERLRCVRVGRLILVPHDALEEFLCETRPLYRKSE